ncbi:hypothetical protein [Nitratifractor sp.]|uniref:hypothetical protein n=1 Tax=Nitratifractor sp. TaxID=2268144 RepID=UPI0025D10A03|nr:hypothetical protein [Nitratifractor sp.]
MRRSLLFLALFGSSLLWAGSSHHSSTADKDLDGVPDRYDRCPHTPFFALVNKYGCTVKKLKLSKKQEKEIKRMLSSSH